MKKENRVHKSSGKSSRNYVVSVDDTYQMDDSQVQILENYQSTLSK